MIRKLNGAEQDHAARIREIDAQAPIDLEYLGIDSPNRRWKDAKAFIDRAASEACVQMRNEMNTFGVLLKTMRNAERRAEEFSPTFWDLYEVKLAMDPAEWKAYEKTIGRELRTALKLGKPLTLEILADLRAGKLVIEGEFWKDAPILDEPEEEGNPRHLRLVPPP